MPRRSDKQIGSYTKVFILPKLNSDHSLVLVRIANEKGSIYRYSFRYQAAWLTHSDFQNVISNNWNPQRPLTENISSMANTLSYWHKDCFGNIQQRKRRLWARLFGIQKSLEVQGPRYLLKLERKLQNDLKTVLDQDELLWFQRSREDWIESGDRNTKFYHTSTLIRKRRNNLKALRTPHGEWIMSRLS